MEYDFNKSIPNISFNEAVEKTKEALKQAGFVGLTEIDLKVTQKK